MKKLTIALVLLTLLLGLVPMGASMAEATSTASTNYATVQSGNQYGVRLRLGPATTYQILTLLPSGTTVTVLESGAVWTRIQAGTQIGYMMTKFLATGSGGGSVTPSGTATVYAGNGLRTWLRAAPNGKRLGLYSDGTPVSILTYGATWSRVMIGSQIGYMMTKYLSVPPAPTATPVPPYAPLTAVTVNYPYPLVGDTLSPILTPEAATATFVWHRVDSDGKTTQVSTNATYKVSATDQNYKIRVTATGTGTYAGASVTYTSNPVTNSRVVSGVMIANTNSASSAPVVSDVLKATIVPSSATVTYSWRVAGVEKSTLATYTVEESDAGKTIQVYVTGTGSFSGSASSAATAKVLTAFEISSVKLSTQYPVVGTVLSATITPAAATADYVWYVNGVTAGTGTTYTATAFDLGDIISVKVSGKGSYTGVATSESSDPVSQTLLTAVTINNTTPYVGATLKATVTPAAAQSLDSVKYQWYLGGKAVDGATEATFTVPKDFTSKGEKYSEVSGMSVYVTASGDGVYGGRVASAITSAVDAAVQLKSVSLNITDPVVGDTITASRTPAIPASDCTFVWQIGSENFVGGETYKVVSTDVGKQIRVQVKCAGGATATSAATNAVVATKAITGVTLYSSYSSRTQLGGTRPLVGQTITAMVTPAQAHYAVTYKWSCSSGGLSGTVNNNNYTVGEGDQGKTITVQAVAGSGYYASTTISATTAAVSTSERLVIDLGDRITPVVGKTPVYTVSGSVKNKANASVSYTASISWSPALANNGTFKATSTYKASVSVTFSGDYSVKEIKSNGAATISSPAGNQVSITYPPFNAQPVSLLTVTGLTPPSAGKSPVTKINDTDQFTGAVSWTPSNDPFQVGIDYTATVSLSAKKGYVFGSVDSNGNVTPYSNSDSLFSIAGARTVHFSAATDGKTAELKVTFAQTSTNTTATLTASRTTVPVGSSKKYVQCTPYLSNFTGSQSDVLWRWELSGGVGDDTDVNQSGLLTIDDEEDANLTLIVTATTTNVKDANGKYYSASVIITTATESALTGDVTVSFLKSPTEIKVGQSGAFVATVGNYNNETITWNVKAVDGTKASDTKISGDGVLSVSENETVKSLAVTAKSVTGVTATAYVTVVYDSAPIGVTFTTAQKSVVCNQVANFGVTINTTNTTPTAPVFTISNTSPYIVLTQTGTNCTVVVTDASLVGTEVVLTAMYTENDKNYYDSFTFIITSPDADASVYFSQAPKTVKADEDTEFKVAFPKSTTATLTVKANSTDVTVNPVTPSTETEQTFIVNAKDTLAGQSVVLTATYVDNGKTYTNSCSFAVTIDEPIVELPTSNPTTIYLKTNTLGFTVNVSGIDPIDWTKLTLTSTPTVDIHDITTSGNAMSFTVNAPAVGNVKLTATYDYPATKKTYSDSWTFTVKAPSVAFASAPATVPLNVPTAFKVKFDTAAAAPVLATCSVSPNDNGISVALNTAKDGCEVMVTEPTLVGKKYTLTVSYVENGATYTASHPFTVAPTGATVTVDGQPSLRCNVEDNYTVDIGTAKTNPAAPTLTASVKSGVTITKVSNTVYKVKVTDSKLTGSTITLTATYVEDGVTYSGTKQISVLPSIAFTTAPKTVTYNTATIFGVTAYSSAANVSNLRFIVTDSDDIDLVRDGWNCKVTVKKPTLAGKEITLTAIYTENGVDYSAACKFTLTALTPSISFGLKPGAVSYNVPSTYSVNIITSKTSPEAPKFTVSPSTNVVLDPVDNICNVTVKNAALVGQTIKLTATYTEDGKPYSASCNFTLEPKLLFESAPTALDIHKAGTFTVETIGTPSNAVTFTVNNPGVNRVSSGKTCTVTPNDANLPDQTVVTLTAKCTINGKECTATTSFTVNNPPLTMALFSAEAPVAEPVAEPVTEPATDSVTEPATEPAKEPVTESAIEPAKEPVAESATEPATEPAKEPATAPEALPSNELTITITDADGTNVEVLPGTEEIKEETPATETEKTGDETAKTETLTTEKTETPTTDKAETPTTDKTETPTTDKTETPATDKTETTTTDKTETPTTDKTETPTTDKTAKTDEATADEPEVDDNVEEGTIKYSSTRAVPGTSVTVKITNGVKVSWKIGKLTSKTSTKAITLSKETDASCTFAVPSDAKAGDTITLTATPVDGSAGRTITITVKDAKVTTKPATTTTTTTTTATTTTEATTPTTTTPTAETPTAPTTDTASGTDTTTTTGAGEHNPEF